MTRDSKDRHTWRKIPSDAVQEARRRVAIDKPAGQDASGPSTRSSWLPSLKLPVRRTAIRGVAGVPSVSQKNFEGGSTLPWTPRETPGSSAPLLRSNEPGDPEYLSAASGGRAGAAATSGMPMTPSDAVPVVVPSTPVIVSGPRARSPQAPPSVREALATIDAAAAQRSARLQSIPALKSAEVPKQAAPHVSDVNGVVDAALQRQHALGRPADQDPPALERRRGAPAPQHTPSGAQPGARAAGTEVVNSASGSSPLGAPPLRPAVASAAADSDKSAPVIAIAGPVTSAQQPLATAETALRSQAAELAGPDAKVHPASPPEGPREQIFRENALRARSEEPVAQPLPEVTGSGWSVLLVLSTLLMVGLGLAYVGRVEQTSIASGVLQVSGGPRPVLAQISGPVLSLEARPGDSVQQGQAIARVDATDLKAREQRDLAQLALLKAEKERISAAELARLQAGERALRQKRALLEERARLKTDAVRDRRERMEQVQHAAHAGVATQGDALAVREAERAASEELLLIRQQIADIDLQLTEAQKNYQATLERLRHDVEAASNMLAETRTLLQTTEIRAPVAGRLESLQVAQGQVIGAGMVLARIVPDGTVSSAVVFAPAKDASFLREGLDASLEFASLPVSEFGKAPARVKRVSKDVASADEIMSALGRGSDEPVIRVELELLPSEQLARVGDKLRSGERLTARLNTRDRRMITLLFDFLRKWYEP